MGQEDQLNEFAQAVVSWPGFTPPANLGLLHLRQDHRRGYYSDAFGVEMTLAYTEPLSPILRPTITNSDDDGTIRAEYAIWLWQVRHQESPVYTEGLWLPGQPESSTIKGWEHVPSDDTKSFDRAAAELKILRLVARQASGKRRSQKWQAITAKYLKYRRDCPDMTMKDFCRNYTQPEISEKTLIPNLSVDVVN